MTIFIECKFIHIYAYGAHTLLYAGGIGLESGLKDRSNLCECQFNTGLLAGFLLMLISAAILILYNRKLASAKKKFRQALLESQRERLLAILESEERERKRIGMDLHDEVGTLLSLLRLMIENIYNNVTEAYVQRCKQLIDTIIGNLRDITHNLSPIIGNAYNFTDALEDLCDSINQLNVVQIILNDRTEGKLDLLNHEVALSLYRVLSELVNNTIKHSRANRVSLKLLLNHDHLVIDYEDNGIGLREMKKGGSGMLNIESRLNAIGASYHLASNDKIGFNFTIEVSL